MKTTIQWLALGIMGSQLAIGGTVLETWPQPWFTPLNRNATAPAKPDTTLRLRTTPGEAEPAVVAIRTEAPLSASVLIEPAIKGKPLKSEWCVLNVIRPFNDKTPSDQLFPVPSTLELKTNETTFLWLTVQPPINTKAGIYHARIVITSSELTRTLTVECEVLPFQLENTKITGGAFMAGTDLPRHWYRDMREHGVNAIQLFWNSAGITVSNQAGQVVLNFTALDKFMTEASAGGIAGPIVISLGNDRRPHYECAIAKAFGMPIITTAVTNSHRPVVAPIVTPELDKLFLDGLHQIHAHWKTRGYQQELVILIYDEPTENLLERCKKRYDLLKTVMPDTRVYGVAMNRRDWAEDIANQCDIIVANGDFEGCRDVTKKHNKDYFVYGAPLRTMYQSRHDMGLMAWRTGASGAFFWMYNYWSYTNGVCAVYRDPANTNEISRSVSWEAMREGHDDLRYVATAEKAIEQATPEKQATLRAQLENIRLSLAPTHLKLTPQEEKLDEAAQVSLYSKPQTVRDELIKFILAYLSDTKPMAK